MPPPSPFAETEQQTTEPEAMPPPPPPQQAAHAREVRALCYPTLYQLNLDARCTCM